MTNPTFPAASSPGSLPPSQTVDAAIDQLGLGAFQWRLLAICGLTWAADAMEVLLSSFALLGVSVSFGLNRGSLEATLFLSATFAGMFVGALVWGRLADRIGRRRVFLITVALGVVFGVAGAFAPSLAWLLLARLLTGFAIGGTLPVDYAMMTEFVPTAWRGRFLVYLESFWALGTIAVAGLAWWLSSLFAPELAWRWLLGLAAVPGLIGLIARLGVPDSPRWLLGQGREAAARAALERVARVNGRSLAAGQLETAPAPESSGFAALLTLLLRRRTLLLAAVWFTLSLGYYGLFSWLPSYLRAQGLELGLVYRTSLILAVAQLPGYLLAALLIDRLGRRVTLVGYLLLSAAGAFLFLLSRTPDTVLLTSAGLSFALLGAWGALYAYSPELFPTPLRASGMGLVSAAARLASLGAPALGLLLLAGNLPVSLGVFAGCLALGAACAAGIGIETRGVPLDALGQEQSGSAARA